MKLWPLLACAGFVFLAMFLAMQVVVFMDGMPPRHSATCLQPACPPCMSAEQLCPPEQRP